MVVTHKFQSGNVAVIEGINMQAPLLNRIEAAQYLGLKPQTLAVWASTKRYDLPYVKVGRLVKYRKEALDEFILDCTFQEARHGFQ